MYRILLPKVALLLNIAITFAGGQQSFYSNNGQAVGGSNGQFNVNPSQASGYPGNNNYGSNPPSVNPYGANNNYGYSGPPQVGYVSQGQAMPQNHQVQGSYSNQAPVLAGYSGNSGGGQQMNYGYAAAPAGGPVNPVGGNVGYGGAYAAPQPTVPTPGVYAGQQQQQPAPTAYNNQNGMPQQAYNVQPQQGQGGGVYAGTTMMNPQSAQGNNHGFTHRILPFGGPVSYGNGPSLAGPSTTMASSSFNGGPSAVPVGLSPQQLLNRRGPFDSMINRAKEWMPSLAGKKSRVKQYFNIGAHDSHRVPKPPKYPLYDMPSAGMATPPPAPLMSPMSAMPSNMYAYSVPPSGGSSPLPGGGQPHRGGRPSQPPPSAGGPRRNKPKGAGKRRRNRPAPPPPPPPPQPKYRGGNKRQRHRGKPKHPKPSLTNPRNSYSNTQISDGYDHPMASNTVPVNSPPLGRPLGYDEYMKKPSHSFTDDPWNFDPNAQSYNEGMNTHAMKYNYDPLGMNTLDMTVQTHLDANKMSYPGDVMQLDSMNQAPKPLSSQLGGWDLPPQSYRTQHRVGSTSSRFDDQHSEGSAFAYDDSAPTTTTTARNSFNQYDGGATEASIVKSETSSPLSLFSSPDGGATIEFDLDALKGGGSGGSNYNDNYKSGNSGSNYNDNYKSGSGSNYDNYKSGSGSGSNYDNYKSGSSGSGSNYDNYKSGSSGSGSNYDNYKSGNSGSGYDNYKSGNRDTDNYDSYKSGSSSGSWGGGDSYNRDRSGDRHDHSDHRDDSRDRYPDETPSTSDFSRGTKSRNSNYDHYDPYSGPGSDYSGYGSRHVRADGDKKLVHRSNNNNDHVKQVETVSSSSAVSEDTKMADKRIPVKLSDSSVLDTEFSSIRERFDAEMRRMEDEMSNFRSQLLQRQDNFFNKSFLDTSADLLNSSAFSALHQSSAAQQQQQQHLSASTTSQQTTTSSSTGGSFLEGLNSPLIQDDGDGKTLKLRFDVSQYAPEEIVLKTVDNKLLVHAKHEEKSETKSVYREYNREFLLPSGVNPELIRSSLSKDGVLTVEAPLPQAALPAPGGTSIPIKF